MEGRFKGSRVTFSSDCSLGMRGRRSSAGLRSFYGLEPLRPPPPILFPVTTARALHNLVLREADSIQKKLTRVVKKDYKIPHPPELLSQISLRLKRRPMRKSYYLGGPPFARKEAVEAMQPPVPSEGSSFSSSGSVSVPRLSIKGKKFPESRREPSKFQLGGLKTQGARSKILDTLEQYRMNSEARMQLKQRADSYVLEKHEKYRAKRAS